MAAKAKNLLITTVSHEIFIVRLNDYPMIRGYCPHCDSEVELVTLDVAISLAAVGGREVIKKVASDEIHTLETATGHLLVCRNSLPDSNSVGG